MNKIFKLKVEVMRTAMTDKIFMTSDNFSLAQRVGVRVSRAFTLAEVLITLVVIGVVAAVTVPMFIHQEGDRVNSERHANIVYKIAQATDLMKSHGNLGKFASTDEFVDELQKYLKINKRCDSNHLQECWTTSKVKTMSGEEFEVKNAKTRKDLLGDEINHPNNPNVGIVLADGANIILTYNPDNEGMSQGDEVKHEAGLLPVGNGMEEFLNFTSNTMNGLAFVFDVNGNRGPNSEQQSGVMKDIRSYNEAKFPSTLIVTDPCDKVTTTKKLKVGDTCYFELPTTYTWDAAKTACPSGSTYVGSPDYTSLVAACNAIKSQNGDNTTSPFSSYWFWAASAGGNGSHNDSGWGDYVVLPDCGANGTGYGYKSHGHCVLCASK